MKVEFIVAGGYPGDGLPKPVAFPDPAAVAVELDGVKYVNLPTLVELKLASGMTNSERMKDLSDVQELIETLSLPAEFAERLDPYVRGTYRELWRAARGAAKRYVLSRKELLTAGMLDAMRADGVIEELAGDDEYARLITTNPDVARKYGMHDESEFMGPEGA